MRENFDRDTYWARLHFESDNRQQKSTVLICASHEYLWDLFCARTFEEVKLEQWLQDVVEKWKSLGDEIFDRKIHYDVYANTAEGKTNGLEFLQKEIKP